MANILYQMDVLSKQCVVNIQLRSFVIFVFSLIFLGCFFFLYDPNIHLYKTNKNIKCFRSIPFNKQKHINHRPLSSITQIILYTKCLKSSFDFNTHRWQRATDRDTQISSAHCLCHFCSYLSFYIFIFVLRCSVNSTSTSRWDVHPHFLYPTQLAGVRRRVSSLCEMDIT